MPATVTQLATYLYAITVQIYLQQCPLSPLSSYTSSCTLAQAAQTTYDFIIIGGGTSGLVLANRLSYNSAIKVLVIEAGLPPSNYTEMPLEYHHLRFPVSMHDWNFKTQPGDYCLGYTDGCVIHQGRGLGGSSLISDMLEYEGNSIDFDNWGSLLWNWNAISGVLANIKHFNGSTSGVMELSYPHSTHEIINKTIMAYDTLTLPLVLIPGARMGYHEIPAYVKSSRRFSSSKGYLAPIISRSNLCILTNTRATKININSLSQLAQSVEVRNQLNAAYNISVSREVILSAGTINSPKLLMLSGIGPLNDLLAMGIPVVVPLEGVGKNLHDHLEFPMHIRLPPVYNFSSDFLSAIPQMCQGQVNAIGDLSNINMVGYINSKVSNLTASALFPDLAITKLLFNMNNTVHLHLMLNASRYNDLTEWFIKGKNMFNPLMILHPTLLHPESRGYLKLASKNIDDQPLIFPNFINDSTLDMEVLLAGVAHVLDMLATNTSGYGDLELVDVTSPNCLQFDFLTQDYWNCTVRSLARPVGNPVGTCRMGLDPMGEDVVNERLKVYGTQNIRVVDGSIVPKITAGDSVTRDIMIAEKAAYYILFDTYFG